MGAGAAVEMAQLLTQGMCLLFPCSPGAYANSFGYIRVSMLKTAP